MVTNSLICLFRETLLIVYRILFPNTIYIQVFVIIFLVYNTKEYFVNSSCDEGHSHVIRNRVSSDPSTL